ncbi:MAG: DoxX family protein [Pseudomonadota bacterium]
MKTPPAADLARLLLRATLAILILLHGIAKLRHGVGPIADMVASHGLPPAFGYLVYVGEVLAPLLVLIGIWTRPAALIVAINMGVAVLLVHTKQLLELGSQGGWALELQAMYLSAALAIALLGAGRYSVAGASGKWN